jgi:CheY-like chemotaxis protein
MDFDVIITDLEMPIEDGLAVLAAARIHRSGAVRILMTESAAHSTNDDHIVITKPLAIEHLHAILLGEFPN